LVERLRINLTQKGDVLLVTVGKMNSLVATQKDVETAHKLKMKDIWVGHEAKLKVHSNYYIRPR
jgi:hypothetical protein